MIQITAVLNGDPVNQAMLICLPDDYLSRTLVGLVQYHHGAGENYSSLLLPEKAPILDGLIALGFCVTSSNAFGNNCGNAASLTFYGEQIDYIFANYNMVAKVILWPQSLGGLSAYLMPTLGRTDIVGIMDAFGGKNAQWMYDHGFGSLYNSAYGISSYAELPAGHDPISLSGSLFDGLRVYISHSIDDTVVTYLNNTVPMRAVMAGHVIENSLTLLHGEHGVEYIPTDEGLAFCLRCVGGADVMSITTLNVTTLRVG